MSGVRRFLSRRDKSPAVRHRHENHDSKDTKNTQRPDHFKGVFLQRRDPDKKLDKEEEKRIKGVLERLHQHGIDNISESNVEYALHSTSSQGDPEAAYRMLVMLEDTYEGIVKPYNSDRRLVGAVNKDAITCYLDTLLFAMFAKLDSFEAMLYENFEDIRRKRLAGLLRLWVNMLRTGRLITTDVTDLIQSALVECGWREAGRHQQQDPSEAFTFITGQLELPMLTLKMDMYHTGKEDPQDDHKFINERLLEVAILDEPAEGRDVITLEDCLEHYFNNRIEVKRHRENQRRNTLKGASLATDATKLETESSTHVEVAEVGPETPITQSPAILTPMVEMMTPSYAGLRPTLGRKRQDSIFSQRTVEMLSGVDPEALNAADGSPQPGSQLRKMSTRTEVLMPAWQFYKLLPWYTDNVPTSDAQVAAHFSKKRPVLGICLKRYSYTNTGQARRRETYVDIPTEIAVPDFVSDDSMHDEGPLIGNFRLVLQSVVCHRGNSVHSGHYVCLSRGHQPSRGTHLSPGDGRASLDSDEPDDRWVLFDDLHVNERIREVDIQDALKKETPYLLFYQVLPIGDDEHDLPSYTEATSRSHSDAGVPVEKPFSVGNTAAGPSLSQTFSAPTLVTTDATTTTERTDSIPDNSNRISFSNRPSLDLPGEERRRKSVTLDTSSLAGSIRTDPMTSSNPTTPLDEKSTSMLSVASVIGSRRGSRVSGTSGKSSRPSSRGPDGNGGGRFSLNMTKLTQRMSRNGNEEVPVIEPSEAVATELAGQKDAAPVTEIGKPVLLKPASIPANPSRESVVSGSKPVGKVRKEKGPKKKGHKAEDRDCVVM